MKKQYLLVALFFALILVLFFVKPIFYDLSLVPAETLYHVENIYQSLASQAENLPSNGLLSDLVFQMYPWQSFVQDSFQSGFIPLWNPYSLTGLPFLANDQSSIFEFTKIVSYLFQISLKDMMLFSGFLILFLAGFFTYLFTRNLKISQTGSLISSLAFMFSGPLIVWLGYPLTSVIIWLPFLLLCTDKIVRQPQKLWIALFALGIGGQFLAGNPEISLFILVMVAIYALFRLSKYRPYQTKGKVIFKKAGILRTKLLILALILGLAVAAVQLMPTLELLQQSQALSSGRGGLAGYNIFEAVWHGQWNSWHSLRDVKHSLESIVLLVYPDFFGNPTLKEHWGITNYNEAALYLGIIPLTLALISLVSIFLRKKKRKDIIFWALIAFVCLGAFLSFPIFRLIGYLPLFKIVAIGRLRFIFVFALAVLAGYGFDFLFDRPQKGFLSKAKTRIAFFNLFYLGLVFFVFFAYLVWRQIASRGVSFEMWQKEKLLLLSIFILINLALWLLFFAKKSSWPYKLGKALFILVVAGELFVYGFSYHPAIDDQFVYPKTKAIEFLQDNIGYHRLTSYKETLVNFSSSLLPNQSVLWQLQDIRGYEVIKLKRYEAFERHFARTNNGFGGIDNRFVAQFFDHKIFNTLGVKYLVQGKDDAENETLASIDGLVLVYDGQSVNIYQNKDVLPRAFLVFNVHPVINHLRALEVFAREEFKPSMTALVETKDLEGLFSIYDNHPTIPFQPAQIIDYTPHQVTITTDSQLASYLVLTDAYEKNWQAYLDGQKVKIYPTNVAFRGIFVPSGQHQIVFKYHPWSFFSSVYISLLALLICLILIGWPVFKKIKKI